MTNLCIADDEHIIRQGLISLPWDQIDAEVTATAENGFGVLEVLHAEEIDVILADVRMPGMDGLEVAKYVASSDLNTQVVLLSGYGDFQYAQQAIEHGVFAYLLKPSTPEQILSAVAGAAQKVSVSKERDLRVELLELELGRRQLVRGDHGLVLGDVSHTGAAQDVLRYVRDNFRDDISLTTMSDELHFSTIYLSRVVKKATGYTFLDILNGLRVQEAARLLRETDETFSSICTRVGGFDPRYFSQVFKRAYGVPPTTYRKEPRTAQDLELSLTVAYLRDSKDN